MILSRKNGNRWKVLDQTFLSMFITFSMIELANVGSGLINGLIVSNFLSATAMAALGVAHPIFSIAGIFGGMFASGMQALCTRALGEGDVPGFKRLFSAMMYIGTAFSLLLAVLLMLFATPLAGLLGASGKGATLAVPAAQYLRGLCFSLPALIMNGVIASGVNMDSGRTRVIIAAIISSASNVLFSLVAVYLRLGMFGIGLATSLSLYAQTVFMLLHFRKKDRMLGFVPLNTGVKEMLKLFYSGTEKALRRLGNVLRPVLVNKLTIAYGGTLAMTAMSIYGNVSNFTGFVGVGLADTIALMVGVYFGEMNGSAIHEAHKRIHRYIALFGGIVSAVLLVFAQPIARLYVADSPQLIKLTTFAIRMNALQTPLNALLRPRIAHLQAVGNTKNMQLLTILSSVVYVVLSAFVLGALFGAYGILTCFAVGDALSLLTVWVYYSLKTHRHIPLLREFLALPESFQLKPGDMIYLDVRNAEDVSLVSEQIGLFCKGHGIKEETGYAAALCFEELAMYTIRSGFPNCKKSPGIDLRVVYNPNELVVRMQDNCPPFDVNREIAMSIYHGEADPEKRLGLKLLGSMASDIKYVHSLETNNVIMRFPLAET